MSKPLVPRCAICGASPTTIYNGVRVYDLTYHPVLPGLLVCDVHYRQEIALVRDELQTRALPRELQTGLSVAVRTNLDWPFGPLWSSRVGEEQSHEQQ